MSTPPFVEAANTPRLHEAFDQLVGEGCWLPGTGLGTFPLRFPHPTAHADTGWHLEATFIGSPGDVYLCHPFLVHAAQPHRGSRPRLMAQPPLYATGALDLRAHRPSPVARAVLAGLHR